MNLNDPPARVATSYFWNCLTLSNDCPFFSDVDPNLYHFGITLASLYAGLLIIILADLKFYWPVDRLQQQVDYYINLVRKKVRNVQLDQRRLMSTQERTEKQLKRCEECKQVVTGIRGALTVDDVTQLNALTNFYNDSRPPAQDTWNATRRCPQADFYDWIL